MKRGVRTSSPFFLQQPNSMYMIGILNFTHKVTQYYLDAIVAERDTDWSSPPATRSDIAGHHKPRSVALSASLMIDCGH
jgi:hypothetical protein